MTKNIFLINVHLILSIIILISLNQLHPFVKTSLIFEDCTYYVFMIFIYLCLSL